MRPDTTFSFFWLPCGLVMLFALSIINVEQMEAKAYDKKNLVQVVTEDSTLVLSFGSDSEVTTWLKVTASVKHTCSRSHSLPLSPPPLGLLLCG